MNLYLLTQNINYTPYTYDSMVICAENPDEAVELSYRGDSDWYMDTDSDWVQYDKKHLIKVDLIGTSSPQIQKGIVLLSFNAD